MKQKEIESFGEIRITGALAADKYKQMTPEEVNGFIKKGVERLAGKFVSQEWTDDVNVTAEYVVIDRYYNVQKKVSAELNYNHSTGAGIVSVVETER